MFRNPLFVIVFSALLFLGIIFVILTSRLGGVGARLAAARDEQRGGTVSFDGTTQENGGGGNSAETNQPDPSNPPAQSATDLASALRQNEEFGSLMTGLQAAGLLNNVPTPATIFAPNRAAFQSLPEVSIKALVENPERFEQILLYHVVPETIPSDAIPSRQELTTLNGATIPVRLEGGAIIGNARISAVDYTYPDGVIHTIDRVLFPPTDLEPPKIDSSGVATFQGDYLTIVGTAQPEHVVILQIDGNRFGSAVVGADGTWTVADGIAPGTHEIVAFMTDGTYVPVAVSDPVMLIVSAPEG